MFRNKIMLFTAVLCVNMAVLLDASDYSNDSENRVIAMVQKTLPMWKSMNEQQRKNILTGFKDFQIKYEISTEQRAQAEKFIDTLLKNGLLKNRNREEAILNILDLHRSQSLDDNPDYYRKQFVDIFTERDADQAMRMNKIFVDNNLTSQQIKMVATELSSYFNYLRF